jgi:hypothetical protein
MTHDLFEQHRHIRAAAEALADRLNRQPRVAPDELNRLRVRLGGLIMQHKADEEAQIYGPLLRDRWIDELPQLEHAMQRVRVLKSGYSEAVGFWTPKAIADDWTGYCAAVRGRVRWLDELIALEEEEIYRPVLAYRAALGARRIAAAGAMQAAAAAS